jgi:hypothetical protein
MTKAYGIALKHCFGMQKKAVDVYMADTSGSRQKPISGSNVAPQARIGLATHENLAKMFQGSALDLVTARFEDAFYKSIKSIQVQGDWTYFPDLSQFLETHLGVAILEGLFGKLLIQQKDFAKDLFEYDRHVMNLARRFPYILAPRAHRAKKKVLKSIKSWHREAQKFENLVTDGSKGRTSTAWGTDAMRERHQMLSQIEGQDEDAIASADLALIWA